MKIKKLFGIFSIASIAVLMSACSKSVKNESLLNGDYFADEAIKLTDYKESIKQKGIIQIASDKTKYNVLDGILILKDADKTYFYNLKDNGKELFSFSSSEILDYDVYSTYKVIRVRYSANDNGDYGYEVYTYDGRCILEKTYCTSLTFAKRDTSSIINGLNNISITRYNMNYTVIEGENYVSKVDSYYFAQEREYKTNKVNTEYLTEDEYYEKYGSKKYQEFDGKLVGLKGYTVRTYNDSKMYLYKGEKLVNIIDRSNLSGIVSDGCLLFQTYSEVSMNDDYDMYFNAKYIKIDTYKMSLKDSSVTKVKNFKYAIQGANVPHVIDEEIKGYYCSVIDFSKSKNVDQKDIKPAFVRGNGNITIHNGIAMVSGDVLEDDKYYYVYQSNSSTSISEDTTAIYDNKGKLTKLYDGIFYDGILAKSKEDDISFVKDSKTEYVLYDYVRINYAKYYGYNIIGEQVLVEIESGDIRITNINEYEVYDDEFLTKEVDGSVKFYTLDSTITEIDFSYDIDDEEIRYVSEGFYEIYNYDTSKSVVFYIG